MLKTKTTIIGILLLLANLFVTQHTIAGSEKTVHKYILINGVEDTAEGFEKIVSLFGTAKDKNVPLGVGFIISYLDIEPEKAAKKLKNYLSLSEQFDIPILVQLDGEAWWSNRPDLWNWWDKDKPGYNPENLYNVEWTSWSPDSAVKIGWRNWGKQIRVLPMPNLMSPKYRQATHAELKKLIPIILNWHQNLPSDKKQLLAGIKLGWESSIGANNWYYPNGNDYLDKSEADDPKYGTTIDKLPDRGVATLGYAAVSTANIARSGEITEKMQAEVVRRHLEDWCKLLSELGVPRELLFTHVGSWVKGENHYYAASNKYSCPGWSFYLHAENPLNDSTAMDVVQKSDAPYWAATEWLLQGNQTQEKWESALRKTIFDANARYVCIYNWSDVESQNAAVEAIKKVSNAKSDYHLSEKR